MLSSVALSALTSPDTGHTLRVHVTTWQDCPKESRARFARRTDMAVCPGAQIVSLDGGSAAGERCLPPLPTGLSFSFADGTRPRPSLFQFSRTVVGSLLDPRQHAAIRLHPGPTNLTSPSTVVIARMPPSREKARF